MSIRKIFSSIFIFFLRITCKPNRKKNIPVKPVKFLIIRQHNQFGDMLATIPLFRAIKEKHPGCEITLIASTENYFAVTKNKYIDQVFNFDKKMLWESDYIKDFWRVLRKGFDIVIVPVTVSISATSCLMARIAKSNYTIGPKSLDGVENKLGFVFDEQIELDWRNNPELNVSQFIFEIVKPLNIFTMDYSSHVTFDKSDETVADNFFFGNGFFKNSVKIGFHVGAGKPPNRWPLENFVKLIEKLESEFRIEFYFTGSRSDKIEIDYMKRQFGLSAGYFLDRSIPELAALISKSSLFITNDTGVMHVAGAVDIPQISIFGPTNPKNWAPMGNNKLTIWKNESIEMVSVDDVFIMAKEILSKGSSK